MNKDVAYRRTPVGSAWGPSFDSQDSPGYHGMKEGFVPTRQIRPVGASIQRTFLHESLVDGEAAPLDPLIRSNMEDRFRTSFEDVRIHKGPRAAGLCRALQCRAFSLDRDIVFGEGQYAPESSVGIQLLAHELVHVMQQRTATARTRQRLVPVGDPLDDLEYEANRLGEQALGAGLRSVPKADIVPTIRRAFSVVDGGWEITTSHVGAKPRVFYAVTNSGDRVAKQNLKDVPEESRTAAEGGAIRITGSVLVRADNLEDIMHNTSPVDRRGRSTAPGAVVSRLHFVQIFQCVYDGAHYAGATSGDGSIAFNFLDGFGMHREPYADAAPENIPFYNIDVPKILKLTPSMIKPDLWKVTVAMSDHPSDSRPLSIRNFATNKTNYLYKMYKSYNVWSTLVIIDWETGVIRPLAHVQWGASCSSKFSWFLDAAGSPQVDLPMLIDAKFYEPVVRQGPPTGPGLVDMITRPTTDEILMYNYVLNERVKSVLEQTANTANVRATSSWATDVVPGDFFM